MGKRLEYRISEMDRNIWDISNYWSLLHVYHVIVSFYTISYRIARIGNEERWQNIMLGYMTRMVTLPLYGIYS